MDHEPRDHAAEQASAMAVGLRVGVELVSALVVALGIGWGLDYWLGTKPWIMLAFVPIGGAAGILNVWRLFAPRKKNDGAGNGAAES